MAGAPKVAVPGGVVMVSPTTGYLSSFVILVPPHVPGQRPDRLSLSLKGLCDMLRRAFQSHWRISACRATGRARLQHRRRLRKVRGAPAWIQMVCTLAIVAELLVWIARTASRPRASGSSSARTGQPARPAAAGRHDRFSGFLHWQLSLASLQSCRRSSAGLLRLESVLAHGEKEVQNA
jgi:hypothetical protein